MKHLLLILGFFFSFCSTFAGEIPFLNQEWQKARDSARAQNKLLFVDYFTDWCVWCKVQDTSTFRDPGITSYVNEHFIPLKIDAEKGIGIDLSMKYRIRGFPTTAFYTPDGYLIAKQMGYTKDNSKYLAVLTDMVKRSGEGRFLKGIPQKVEMDVPEFYRNAFLGNGKRTFPDSSTVASYLAKQTDLFTEANFSVIFMFPTDPKTEQFFLDNRDKYAALFGSEDVDQKISEIIYRSLQNAIAAKDSLVLNETLGMIDRYLKDNREENRSWYLSLYYKGVGDWKRYAGLTQEQITAGKADESAINNAAWTIYEKADDPAVVRTAIGWMSKVVVRQPIYMYLDTYAALLYKDKQYAMAEEYAVKAIADGKNTGENVKSTEELLDKIRKKQ